MIEFPGGTAAAGSTFSCSVAVLRGLARRPAIPSANMHLTTLALAERAAEWL